MKINRKDAEKLILNQANPFGTFLIRSSETAEGKKESILLGRCFFFVLHVNILVTSQNDLNYTKSQLYEIRYETFKFWIASDYILLLAS